LYYTATGIVTHCRWQSGAQVRTTFARNISRSKKSEVINDQKRVSVSMSSTRHSCQI